MARDGLLRMTSAGWYCAAGGFHVDPCAPTVYAIVTHAHADHFVRGCRRYLTSQSGAPLLQARVGSHAVVDGLRFGESLTIGGVRVSLHPAGHILGSAQVRIERDGEVWVITGDYKTDPDPTCEAFELVRCDTLVTESTFGRPCFVWPNEAQVMDEIHAWWRGNQERGVASFIYAYALGKAQRLLARLDPTQGPIAAHRDVEQYNVIYRTAGGPIPVTLSPNPRMDVVDWGRALIVLPPSARWQQGFPYVGDYETAFASGWMLLPNGPARKGAKRGFVLSDHADHGQLLATVRATGAGRVYVTHGHTDELTAELSQMGLEAIAMPAPNHRQPPTADE